MEVIPVTPINWLLVLSEYVYSVPLIFSIPLWGNPTVESTNIVVDSTSTFSTEYFFGVDTKTPEIDPLGLILLEYPANIFILYNT